MGFGSFGMFGGISREIRTAQAKLEALDAKQHASQAQDEVRRLGARVERLALGCQALWELIRDRAHLKDDELVALINEIDLRDGAADGKIQTKVVKCPACGRNSNSRRGSCLFCGAPMAKDHVFE
jgi:hypothetical protein